MIINLLKPSLTEAELAEGAEPNVALQVKPRRWSSKQQSLTVMPVEVVNAQGIVLDAGVLTVNQKTGSLSFSKVSSSELECEADKLSSPPPKGKKKGGKTL